MSVPRLFSTASANDIGFTPDLKNFTLGGITETNIGDGVYRYTFSDADTPYKWSQLAKTSLRDINFFCSVYQHYQYTGTSSMSQVFSYVPGHYLYPTNRKNIMKLTVSGSTVNFNTNLPTGRFNITPGDVLESGDTSLTSAYHYPFFQRFSSIVTNPANIKQGYVDLDFNALSNAQPRNYTNAANSKLVAGRTKIIFQPLLVFDGFEYASATNYSVGTYLGNAKMYNTTITGSALATPASVTTTSPVTNLTWSGRQLSWTEPTNITKGNYLIYLFKWNGSSYVNVHIAYCDQSSQYGSTGVSPANWNTYTIPASETSGTYIAAVFAADGYSGVYSSQTNSPTVSI